MQLIKCQDQKKQTLDEFYMEISLHEGFEKVGKSMIDLINKLRAVSDDRQVFGLNSLYRLCLLSKDAGQSPWYVIIAAIGEQMYRIEYLLPERHAPWPDAYVMGEARSEDEAVEIF